MPRRGPEVGDPRSVQNSLFMRVFHENVTNFHLICLSFKLLRFSQRTQEGENKSQTGELTGIRLVRKTQAFY
jgi:hypothetical protein